MKSDVAKAMLRAIDELVRLVAREVQTNESMTCKNIRDLTEAYITLTRSGPAE